jgi:DNA-binding SARP family transcriptional activator/tetratricopeptide (TPR) repeat protein
MYLLSIRLFGGLALYGDNRSLAPVPGTTTRSLLAYLVTYRDRPHTRNLLAGTFWPDLPDATARRRLSQALWRIRRALPSHPILLTEGDTVQINPDHPLWIDLEEFRQQVASYPQQDGQLATGSLLRAVELYRGDFLAGYYDDWVLLDREQLRETFLGVLERLVGELKLQGEYDEALVYALRLATEDPLREEAHREVMRLCHVLRRDHEALQQYRVCFQVLAEELGTKPSAETVTLADEIAAMGEGVEVPHLPAVSRSSPLALLERTDRVPLVGRRSERAQLARCLELATAGSGGILFLAGEAGVGKTRLMQEMARDAAWRGIEVVWGHSCELSAPSPYQPLVEALHDADLTHLATVWRQELSRLMPVLGHPPPSLEPEEERGRLLEGLARAFLALGEVGPHLIVLEDVQWMDPASFDALRTLLPRLPRSRLLLVGTLRPEELPARHSARRSLEALEITRIPQRLVLPSLMENETELLIQRALDMTDSVPRFSRRLHTETAGNPFFITETLRVLVDEGLLYRNEQGSWSSPWDDTTNDYAELPVPLSITQGIEQRLDHLPSTAQDLLGVAAIVGRQVDFDLWLAAGGGDEGTVLSAAEDLTRRGLLVELEDALGYCFAHDTVRQVVYRRLSPMRRRLLHRRVAAALQAFHPDQVEALARHFHLGQDWHEAVHYALCAGGRAQAVYANRQALEYYDSADAWLAQGRVDWHAKEINRWRADLAERQGRVHSLVGEYEGAEAAFARSLQTWVDLDDRCSAARVLNRLSFLCFIQNSYAEATDYAQRALAYLPETNPPDELRATSLTYLGLSAWTQGRYDAAIPPLEEARSIFEELGTDLYGLARCLNSLGLVHLEKGDTAVAEACIARSLALRRQIGDRRGEGFCCLNQAQVALAREDAATFRLELEDAHRIFAEIGSAEGLDACARLLSKFELSDWASTGRTQVVVRLPRADAPSGRPLGDREYTTVHWTVADSEDDKITGKAARRQHRLLRLLDEAEEQRAAPTVDDLATALDVSQPTIKRDLSALRQAGHEVRTRGSRGR